ncbi:MAG: rod shape-determining protein [Flavobacterium sp.]|nr:rod shape-determining protein [Candidatus Neoflavobacterium equi]
MIEIKKFGAIDIGSNAMRLLICNVVEQPGKEPVFNKSSLIRVPIRLGQDVFTSGTISEQNKGRMIDAMRAFHLLMKVHQVQKYRACATSAMREAANGVEVQQAIASQSEIVIDIIDGKEEASIIASTDLNDFMELDKNYIYVDVGGGSTEVSIFSKGTMVASNSFKIGTVRLLNEMVDEEIWDSIRLWIKEHVKPYKDVVMIGSGGNINKIFKLSNKPQSKPLSYTYLNQQFLELSALSYEERISELALNSDRADVIVPALKIYTSAMKWSGAKNIFVPKIGLSDGIVKSLYYNN